MSTLYDKLKDYKSLLEENLKLKSEVQRLRDELDRVTDELETKIALQPDKI